MTQKSEKVINKIPQPFKDLYGKIYYDAEQILDDCVMYHEEDFFELYRRRAALRTEPTEANAEALRAKCAEMKMLPNPPQRIYLWPEGKMPAHTDYTDNSDYRYNHDPDFRPYMFEMLLPQDVTPKGAVIVIPGGDQGGATVGEGYGTCKDLNELGYQCFILHNRCFNNPWDGMECGADVARAIRIVRKNAEKYRINPNNVTVMGCSNGGLTGDRNIRYYSGKQTVKDHFPTYEPDELDDIYGAPDAYICMYGTRYIWLEFDYSVVDYPPTFFAVGREDKGAMTNLTSHYAQLLERGIPVEVHTFAATPHGYSGQWRVNGVKYPNFELWSKLADAFMQDTYHKESGTNIWS